jgi:hypothetical protein
MRVRRVLVALVAAALVGVTLTGCQTIGSIADKVLIESSLRDLTAQLEKLEGVTAQTSEPELQGDYSYTAGIAVTATVEDSINEVVADLRGALATDVFQRNTLWATLTLTEAGVGVFTLSSFDIPDGQLQNGLARWHTVAKTASVPVSVGMDDNGNDTYLTFIGIDSPVTSAKLEQLSELGFPTDGTVTWSLPGLDYLLPDAEGRAFFETITHIMPPLSYGDHPTAGVQLSWSPDSPWFVTVALDDVVDKDLAGSLSWPDVKRVLAAAIDSGSVRDFTVQLVNGAQGGTVHLGQCPAEVTGLDADVELLAALGDVRLPAGSGAGWC